MVQVFLRTNWFLEDQAQYCPSMVVPLPMPTNDTLVINRWVDHLADLVWRDGYKYKNAGIMLSEITPETQLQTDWLEPIKTSDSKLMIAIDTLNQRYGRGAVNVSSEGLFGQWHMRQERKSPAYTTSWLDLPAV